MANFPFVIGDALQIGTATITATGNAVVLPTGTQVGSTAVATSTEVATGGGPKITNLQVIDNSFQVLDDTAVDITGGYIKITGTNFTSGCIVYIGLAPATATSFVSATEVRAQLAATAAGTYPVYLVNPDGGVAIRVPGVTFSASPSWQTASALSDQYDGAPLTLALVASDATSYTLVSGALPPGLSLNSSTGAITGTITGVTVDTVYTFTVRATDAQNQDSPRTFTVNVAVSDTYFRLTTLLLSGSAIPANTVVRDSSTNNFNLTVFGDARASNFTPYGTGWSVYFDGTGDYLSLGNNNPLPATGDFTFECWIYVPSLPGVQSAIIANQNQSNRYMLWLTSTGGLTIQVGASFSRSTGNNVIAANRWYHIATTRTGTTHNLFVDGIAATLTTSGGSPASIDNTEFFIGINYNSSYAFTGYISNFRVVTSILYTSTFTPSTGSLTAITNTSLLTCHANRFLDGSTNNFAITRNGDARVVSFNPFNITNTGVDGSAYFDGTGDYITAPFHASEYNFGTGNFTIQAWFYIDTDKTIAGANGGMIFNYQFENFQLYYVNSPSYLYCDIRNWGTNISLQSTTQMRQGQWYHVAIIRDGVSSVKMYLNGVLESTSTTNPGSINFNTYNLYIGVRYNPSGGALDYYHKGYISNYRITNTAIAAGNLLVAATAVTGTKLLTLQYDQPHNNHTFLDSSSNQFLITRMGNATQGTFSPFGPGRFSRYFVNYESYNLNSMLTGWGLGLTTTELWLNSPSRFGIANAYDCVAANGRYGFQVGTDRKVYVTFTTGTGSQFDLGTTNLVTFNQWNHIAIQIDARTNTSAVITVYINGVGETFAAQNMSTQTSLWANPTVGRGQTGCFSFANDTGYVSDYRIVKDEFVYTGNFTPPTAPLAVSGALSANAYPSLTNVSTTWTSANCIVLMYSASSSRPDNIKSGSSIVLTKGTDTRTTNFSPYQNSAVYSPVVHGGSAYFDGSGDYLTFVNNNQINFGSSPFTIEVWFYSVSTNTRQDFITQWASGNKSSYLGIGITGAASRIQFAYSTTGSNELSVTDTTNFVPYQWYHVAACRTANTISLFVNGVRVATTTETGSIFNSTRTPVTVGAYSGNSGEEGVQPLVGYLSGLRVIKGSSVYDATQTSITVPTAPVTSTANTQLLLNFTDAAILDSTGRTVLETVADAKTSSVVTKFTGGSMSFDGTGDYLQSSAPLSELAFLHNGTPWTIEGWFYTGSTSPQTILSTDAASATIGMTIDINSTTTRDLACYIYRGVSGSWHATVSSGSVWSLSTWTYFAVVLDASKNLTVYINGVQVATASGSSFSFSSANPSYPLVVGRYQAPTPGGYFNGYISDLRVTRGYARYTANFTAPTAPARLK